MVGRRNSQTRTDYSNQGQPALVVISVLAIALLFVFYVLLYVLYPEGKTNYFVEFCKAILPNLISPLLAFLLIYFVINKYLKIGHNNSSNSNSNLDWLTENLEQSVQLTENLEQSVQRLSLISNNLSLPSDQYEHDVFISFPMSSLPDAQYQVERQNISKLVQVLQERCQLNNIFCAGNEITQSQQYEDNAIGARDAFQALAKSRWYILVYPEKLASSVLVEAGYALALRKPSVYFVRRPAQQQVGYAAATILPYLLTQPPNNIVRKIYHYTDINDIVNTLKRISTIFQ